MTPARTMLIMAFPSTHRDSAHSGWDDNWVWMPPWGPERITDDGRDQMRALGFAI